MSKIILISGARGVVGRPLCEEFERRDCHYIAVSRNAFGADKGVNWDMGREDSTPVTELESIDAMVHCAPIWLLPRHLPTLADLGLKRLIAFSSSSVLSKKNTQDATEQELVRLLDQAEKDTASECDRLGIAFTIFRPTMIYGFGLDENVSRLARFIKRWGFAVVAGNAEGLRQPVHCLDLVEAVFKALDTSSTCRNVYTLAGGETLTYRNMLNRIFEALNKPARVISLPVPVYRCILRLAALTGRFAYTSEMADRMNSDLAYDITPATNGFGYTPSPFLEQAERDLPDLLA